MQIIERALSLLAPHICVMCETEGSVLCEPCRIAGIVSIPSRCFLCFKATDNFSVCKPCKSRFALSRVWIASEYESPVKQVIQKLKYQFAREAHKVLAQIISDSLPYALNQSLLMTHIPTATARIRARGFDHAELIAKEVAAIRGWDYSCTLVRTTDYRQVGSPRSVRLTQLENSYRIINPDVINSRHILFVDDVITTGATINTCAKALKTAGAKSVSAAVVAQAIHD